MAVRPVFISISGAPFVKAEDTGFIFYPGFAVSQSQKSILSLHSAFKAAHPEYTDKVLEISSKSPQDLGIRLSAFNLMYTMTDGSRHSVETVFQSGKKFENGQQYIDLLNVSSHEAKKDERLRNSGKVTGFGLDGVAFPTEPVTFFYDWLYVNALTQNPGLAEKLMAYSTFTDIAFNPEKSLNCQARSAAVYVGLVHSGLLEKALRSPEDFRHTVYETSITAVQQTMFDLLNAANLI